MNARKHDLRAAALRRRESQPAERLQRWNQRIQEGAVRFSPYAVARAVVLYSPIGNEVATEAIRDHALAAGKSIFYPKPGRGESLDLATFESAANMKVGRYGILEPAGGRTFETRDRNGVIVFVPGVVFDLDGNRLGRGAGWYDRLLKHLGTGPTAVALAYEFQIVKRLPAEERDQKVQYIITERRIIDCGAVAPQSRWIA